MWMVYSAMMAALDLQRTCPKCGVKKKVKLSHKGKAVTCDNCGHTIHPPKYRQT